MNKDELYRAIDGLFAYDDGARSSGIHDEVLRERVQDYLKSLTDKEYDEVVTTMIREHWLSDEAIAQGYGWEDTFNLLKWLENGCSLF